MYANFFGLRELPFNNTPDPRFFYSTPDHEEALASLVYAVRERKGFVLLTGEVGAGKTLISRMALRQFGGKIAFANINHAVQDAIDLMESICAELEIDVPDDASNAQLVRILQDFLLSQFALDRPVVLVVDEAQDLAIDVFEQLRMIGNLEADDAKLLQVIIVGQPELQRRFATHELRQLRQRVFRTFHLPALSREAMEAYINHRMTVAGVEKQDVFDTVAIEKIWACSRGLPRLINTICDNAMLSAYSADVRTVDGAMIDSVVDQMMMLDTARDGGMNYTPEYTGPVAQTSRVGPAMSIPTGRAAPGARTELPSVAIDALARTVVELEGHRWWQQTGGQMSVQAARDALHRESNDILDRAIQRFEQQVEAKIQEAEDRLGAIEEQLHGAPALIAQARSARADLESLLRRTEAVLARTETAHRRLDDGEVHLRDLAGKLSGVVKEVRRIHTGLKKATLRTNRVERGAQAALDRLVNQTEQSRDLADNMTQLFRRMITPTGEDPTARPRTVLAARRQATAETIQDRDVMLDMLSNARDSLTELRTVARSTREHEPTTDTPPSSTRTPNANSDDQSTNRLEQQVENLLDVVNRS